MPEDSAMGKNTRNRSGVEVRDEKRTGGIKNGKEN